MATLFPDDGHTRPLAFDTMPVRFTLAELWMLNGYVRHEGAERDWKFPPFSRELNEAVIFGIVMCEQENQSGAILVLSEGDCHVIDFHIRASMKGPNGEMLGRDILQKVFVALSDIRQGRLEATAQDVTYETPVAEAVEFATKQE